MKPIISSMSIAIMLTACGSQQGEENGMTSGSNTIADVAAAGVDVPNACTFFSKAELETAVGRELRDGEAKDVSAGSSCGFESVPAMYATRTFPNPALPASTGFGSLTVNTYPSAAETFAQGRQYPGVEAVPGLGSDAYFNGPDLLQVRVGERGFSVRIYADGPSPADRAKIREVMLSLGRKGVSRL